MSVMTEYFVATDDEVGQAFAGWRWGTGSIPPPSATAAVAAPVAVPNLARFPRVTLPGVSPAELVTLREAVGDVDIEAGEQLLRPLVLAPPIANRTQWLHRLPDAFVAALSAMETDELTEVGRQWARLERARIADIADDAVRASRLAHHRERFWQDMLAELAVLSDLAVHRRKSIFLYIRLSV